MFNIREYQQQQQAVQAIEKAPNVTLEKQESATQTVLEIALKNEVNKIRSLPSLSERAKYKRENFLPKWLSFCDEYFAKGERYQNDVLGYCILYLLDVEQIEKALDLAEKAIKDGQAMPDGFSRTIEAVVADEVMKWCERIQAKREAIEPYFSRTLKLILQDWTIHEFVVAKWLKFTAKRLLMANGRTHPASINEPERLHLAIQLANFAYELNHKVGVMNLIERSLMRLKALELLGLSTTPSGGQAATIADIDISRLSKLLCRQPLSLSDVMELNDVNWT